MITARPDTQPLVVPEAPVSRPPHRPGFSPVWIIPLFAVLLGLWMAWRFYSAKGPEIMVRFESAEGIIAGKTPVLCRSVPVGIVTRIALSNDLLGMHLTPPEC
jgi:paraquat-inducible protein B